MMQAYRWALITPDRRRLYNTTITLTSAVTAAVIGLVGFIDLAGAAIPPESGLRAASEFVEANVNTIGIGLLCIFAAAWLLAFLNARRLARRQAAAARTE